MRVPGFGGAAAIGVTFWYSPGNCGIDDALRAWNVRSPPTDAINSVLDQPLQKWTVFRSEVADVVLEEFQDRSPRRTIWDIKGYFKRRFTPVAT